MEQLGFGKVQVRVNSLHAFHMLSDLTFSVNIICEGKKIEDLPKIYIVVIFEKLLYVLKRKMMWVMFSV